MYLNSISAYVYKIRHIPTGKYYYGFRKAHIKANRTPEQDFFVYYYSSSKIVESMIKDFGIDQFEYSIVYQDTDIREVFWYEQDLIKKNWGDPLMINKQYRDRDAGQGVFLLDKRPDGVTDRIKKTKLKKYGTLSPVRPGSVEKMVATRKARDNYKQGQTMIDKMLSTKQTNGTMNSNTPESRAKSRQTKIDRYGVPQPKHTPETIQKLKKIPHTQEQIEKCLETKRQNGTMNSNTPETIVKRKETLLAKWGTVNTREIARLKSLEKN
jgi:hypothetical protein